MCWFLDAGNDETLRTLKLAGVQKSEGTKSREVGRRRCSELRDLAAPALHVPGKDVRGELDT